MKVTQLCLTLCNPVDLYSPWNSPCQHTIVGSLSLSKGSSQPRDRPQVSLIVDEFFTSCATGEAHEIGYMVIKYSSANRCAFGALLCHLLTCELKEVN